MLQTRPTTTVTPDATGSELAKRMAGPQRYRLLQGYPMPPLMPLIENRERDPLRMVHLDAARPLILGVLPHTSCAPALAGCGFCTFPHEKFQVSQVKATCAAVVREIQNTLTHRPELGERQVDAVYLGGGTANLTPADSLAELCQALSQSFSLETSEVTLEGVPAFFLAHNGRLLDVLRSHLPTPRLRLSMGIQTFNPDQIASMGRQAFGDREVVGRVLALAQDRGFTHSGDFLINLPGQSRAQMLLDIQQAVELGLDQICLYHLVLFAGIGTAWGRDKAQLAGLPQLADAYENWAAVRQFLLENDYVQTSLTNFEKASRHHSSRRFLYEDCSFHPGQYDGLGFGPAALSTFTDRSDRLAVKTMNEERAADYQALIQAGHRPTQRQFLYGEPDLKLLYLTRQLSRLEVSRAGYHQACGGDPIRDFPEEMAAIQHAGLIEVTPETLRLTPRGMFYADSVAGLLASRRVKELRLGRHGDPNNSLYFIMG